MFVLLVFLFVFLLVLVVRWNRDGLLGYVQVLHQFTFGAPQLADGHMYALISQFAVSMQHAIECVERPGESQ